MSDEHLQSPAAPIAPAAKRSRSPGYPTVDLETSLARAEKLFEVAKKHEYPAEDTLRVWGHSPTSGQGGSVLAAVKRFGLIADVGGGDNRLVKVTDLFLDIHYADHDPAKRLNAVKEAALRPPIMAELWEKFGPDLPGDAPIRSYLAREKGFSDTGTAELIGVFRRTVEFASLTDSDIISESSPDRVEDKRIVTTSAPAEKPPTAPARHGLSASTSDHVPAMAHRPIPATRIPIGVGGGKWVILEGEFPIGPGEWDRMIAVLQAMAPGLTDPPWAKKEAQRQGAVEAE